MKPLMALNLIRYTHVWIGTKNSTFVKCEPMYIYHVTNLNRKFVDLVNAWKCCIASSNYSCSYNRNECFPCIEWDHMTVSSKNDPQRSLTLVKHEADQGWHYYDII